MDGISVDVEAESFVRTTPKGETTLVFRRKWGCTASIRQICMAGWAAAVLFQASAARAQDAPATGAPSAGTPVVVSVEGGQAQPVLTPSKPEEAKPGGPPPGSAPPSPPAAHPPSGPGPSGPPAEQAQTKPEAAKPPAVISRPKEAEIQEWETQSDETGRIRVNFRGQSWPKVLEWIADISHMSLDWQELPGDYLNLVTQQTYTVEELRNLINQHLFQRGFTMLQQGEVLTVVNLEKLDPGIVPHVSPEQLDSLPTYDFVRTTFRLQYLLAEQAVEEFKPLLSPRGKLDALSATNRLEAMDVVANLRQIARLLREEESQDGQERLVREFVLQYARAQDTAEQLKELLGLKQGSALPPGLTPEQIQQMQQAMAAGQPVVMAGGVRVSTPPGQKGQVPGALRPRPDVNLVVNTRRNAIVAQAPPDKMAIIEQAVKLLDVPDARTGSIMANMGRWQVYRLAAIDPEPLVKTLQELGGLDPSTRLEVDKQNNAVIAYAPLADHVTIKAVIDRLDGSGRRFEVIQLRRLPADYVAGSIEFMMGGQEDQGETTPSWLPPWERSRSRREESNSRNRFRVDADVENNRLLLWANEIEIQEVQKLLVKLGEIADPSGESGRMRVVDFSSPEEAEAVLKLLERQWSQVAPNPLRVLTGPPSADEGQSPQADPSDRGTPQPEAEGSRRGDQHSPPAPSAGVWRSPPAERLASKSQTPWNERNDAMVQGDSSAQVPGRPRLTALPAVLSTQQVAEPQSDQQQTVPTTQESSPREEENVQQDNSQKSDLQELNLQQGNSHDANSQQGNGQEADSAVGGSAPGENTQHENPLGHSYDTVGSLPSGLLPEPQAAPPLTVYRSPNGQLIFTCRDPRALALLDQLLQNVVPEKPNYQIFRLKYIWADSMANILEELFSEEEKTDRLGYPWFFDPWASSSQSRETPSRLSRRKPVKFVADVDTNSLLVQNADERQLRQIKQIIEFYDQPPATDAQSVRVTEIIPIRNSKATQIATALKDVYRDLLSPNDRQRQGERGPIVLFGSAEGDTRTPKFKGLLSIGVDEVSNSVVVSAPQYLMTDIRQLITQLDREAEPNVTTVEVVRLKNGLSAEHIRKGLSAVLDGKSSSEPRREGSSASQPGPGRPPQPER